MVTKPLVDWIRGLTALATQPGAPFDIHTGPLKPVKDRGALYYLSYRERNDAPAPWFNHTLHAQREILAAETRGAVRPSWLNYRVFLLIHWGWFLWQAASVAHGETKKLAHSLLVLLVDLIEQFDTVLADDIRLLENRRSLRTAEFRAENPLDVGFNEASEMARFDRHLKNLLNNPTARNAIVKTMNDSLHLAVIHSERLKLIACPGGNKHRRGEHCEKCVESKWVRGATSLFAIDRLQFKGPCPFELKLADPGLYVPATDNWNSEARRILDSLHADEGVVRIEDEKYGSYALVNFEKLVGIAASQRRIGALLDAYYTCDKRLDLAGVHARRTFLLQYGSSVLARRPKSLEELVTAAGWMFNASTLDVQYELYSVPQIYKRLKTAQKSVQHLMNMNPTAFAKKGGYAGRRRENQVIALDYRDADGKIHGIQCIQRYRKPRPGELEKRVHNYYTVPYEVAEELGKKTVTKGHIQTIGSTTYYDLHLINKHVNYKDSGGTTVHPSAAAFAEWLAPVDSSMSRARFRKLRYAMKYVDRIGKRQRGERKSIGLFLPQEDKVILDFMFTRDNKTKPLDPLQWNALLAMLPGRSKRGVTERLLFLGKRYCTDHGWVAYAASGLCMNRTAARRKAWSGLKNRKKT
jgi:hypothetical protein